MSLGPWVAPAAAASIRAAPGTARPSSTKFDPAGGYIRRWVPELAKLEPPAVFAPWQASPADLEAAGVHLGTDYPHPILDHTTARNRALARYQAASSRRS